jgi:type III restriction enzyme
MKLKKYQQDTIDVLKRFFEACRIMGAKDAYHKITGEPEVAARLGGLRGGYESWETIPNTPRVCLKVPTGGGKTIIAAHAVKVVADTWCERENPVVLWFCPSDTVRRQTYGALINPRHPYRMVLNERFGGRVRVFDIDDKFNIRPADIENGACVVVSSVQAFRQENTAKYKVYRHNENLEPHFARIGAKNGMERDDSGNVKFSFANLLFHHRPIMIVDEAHGVISNLSQEVHGRLNPSAIVELTATPRVCNNTLYSVSAAELKDEEMIKLPIDLWELPGWEQAVSMAIVKRAELERAAGGEAEYVRPILLFQAQDKNGEVSVEALRDYLINSENIPAAEIAVATGEQKELDGVNVFARDCPVKYIVTVEALKEGWDCSFAYVLCSLANIHSNTAVEQLLGRVMRMPYAKRRGVPALNRAYAFVLSKTFGEAAAALVNKLKNKGFDDGDVADAIELRYTEDSGFFGRYELDRVDLDEPLSVAEVPETIKTENGGKTIVFTPETTEADVESIVKNVPPKIAEEIRWKFSNCRWTNAAPPPARMGAKFRVPRMMVELQGEFELADPDRIFEEYDWNIIDFADPKMDEREFNIGPQGAGFVIEIDGRGLKFGPSGEQPSLPGIDVETWTAANLVAWLDRALRQEDIPQPKNLEWLRRAVDYLVATRGISLSALMPAKRALAGKLEAKIEKARGDARKQAFQTALFKRESRVMLDFDNGFEFFENIYDGEAWYRGNYRFQKHYLGPVKVPAFDGKADGEEFQCAQAIDNIPRVKYWLRNVSKHKNSFWLPTSTDKFYPDFVAELEDGRILVAEYKGAHLIGNEDTKEKNMIGELWEKQSGGKGLFLIVTESVGGLDMAGQVKKKIGCL